MKLKRFRFSRQFDQMDCGPTCIRMVAMHYGRKYPLSYLRTLSNLTREGVSVAGIRNAFSKIGMRSASYEMTLEQLERICPLPAILYWEQNHFVVLYNISRSKFSGEAKYSIANPAYGKTCISTKDFSRCWLNGSKGVVIAAEPTEAFYTLKEVKEKHSFLKFGRQYVMPYKKEILQLIIGLVGGMLLSLVTPFLTQAMVDNGILMKDMNVILLLMMAQLFMFCGTFLIDIIRSWVTLHISTKINISVLNDYLAKLLKLPIIFFEIKSIGDYQQRIGDHAKIQDFTTHTTIQTLFSIVSGSVLLVIVGYYNWLLLLVYLSFTGLSILWMSYFWNIRKSLNYEVFRLYSKNQNVMYELMSGIVDIKLNSYSDYKMQQWRGMQDEVYSMNQKSLRLGQIQDVGFTMIEQLRNILITYWIATQVVDGNLTLGMMMSVSNILGQINGPLSQLTGFLQQFQDAKISLERSEEVQLCENEDNKQMLEISGESPQDIEIQNLSFSYTGERQHNVLKNINLRFPAGKMTAIVGESGSGKTTLVKLLLKFYKPTEGCILINGMNAELFSAASIRKRTGIVMQENFVFSDTIRRNIILGEVEDEKRLLQSIRLACLDAYIERLPLGVYTKIGAEGSGVSGGEKQRLMIARAIYKSPLYFMLDEATSSLDADTERRIIDNLDRALQGKTRIVVAHRLSTVKNADNIIVLRHGEVVEEGTHTELVSRKGYYYNLVKNQLEIAAE